MKDLQTVAMQPFWQWSATEIAAGIRKKMISSEEVTKGIFERIDDVNPKLNALVELLREEALVAACQADREVTLGEELGLLHGVPIATKINTDQQGLATTDGVVAFKENIAVADSPQIANLKKGGAVIVGRSNVPAFSIRWFTNNDLHGNTLNPWDQERTPGGSSGGASSAVASGMVPIAHGNDIGGSIRYPAYACGVMGIRPTVGRIPRWTGNLDSTFPLAVQMMVADGPIARTVDDLRLSLAVMAKPDFRDVNYVDMPLIGSPLPKPTKVAVLRQLQHVPNDPAVNEAIDQTITMLKAAGYEVDEVSLDLFDEAYKLWYLLAIQDLKGMKPLVEQFSDEATKTNFAYNFTVAKELWGEPTFDLYQEGYARRGTLIVKLQAFLEEYPLLITPVSAEQAFKQNADVESLDSNRQATHAQWPMMAVPLLGFPAMSIPIGITNGLPTGVQIIGRRFREDTIFDLAEVLEAHSTVQTPIDPMF